MDADFSHHVRCLEIQIDILLILSFTAQIHPSVYPVNISRFFFYIVGFILAPPQFAKGA